MDTVDLDVLVVENEGIVIEGIPVQFELGRPKDHIRLALCLEEADYDEERLSLAEACQAPAEALECGREGLEKHLQALRFYFTLCT